MGEKVWDPAMFVKIKSALIAHTSVSVVWCLLHDVHTIVIACPCSHHKPTEVLN